MAKRDANGRFTKGNQAAKGGNGGRPAREVEEKFYRVLSRRVRVKDWEKVIDVAIARAKTGDSRARQWLSDYLMGKPVQRTELTGLDGGKITLEVVYPDDE